MITTNITPQSVAALRFSHLMGPRQTGNKAAEGRIADALGDATRITRRPGEPRPVPSQLQLAGQETMRLISLIEDGGRAVSAMAAGPDKDSALDLLLTRIATQLERWCPRDAKTPPAWEQIHRGALMQQHAQAIDDAEVAAILNAAASRLLESGLIALEP